MCPKIVKVHDALSTRGFCSSHEDLKYKLRLCVSCTFLSPTTASFWSQPTSLTGYGVIRQNVNHHLATDFDDDNLCSITLTCFITHRNVAGKILSLCLMLCTPPATDMAFMCAGPKREAILLAQGNTKDTVDKANSRSCITEVVLWDVHGVLHCGHRTHCVAAGCQIAASFLLLSHT